MIQQIGWMCLVFSSLNFVTTIITGSWLSFTMGWVLVFFAFLSFSLKRSV